MKNEAMAHFGIDHRQKVKFKTREVLSQRYLTIKAIFDIISIRTSKMRVEIALIIIISLASVTQSTT